MDHPTPDSFEQAFSAFLDSRQGDSAEEALFRLLRMAFSAGGPPPADRQSRSRDNSPPFDDPKYGTISRHSRRFFK